LRFLNGGMGHAFAGVAPANVFTGRKPDHITGSHFLDRPASR